MRSKNRRFQVSLSTLVGAGSGGFVALAIALVLGMSVTANFQNTFSLLNDKTILSTQGLEQQLRTHFASVENAVVGLQPSFENGLETGKSPDRILEDLTLALKSNQDITTLAITWMDGRRLGIYRALNGKLWRIKEAVPPPGFEGQDLPELAPDSPPTWGEVVIHDVGTFSNVSVPLVSGGSLTAVLTAATSMEDLAEIVSARDEGPDNTVFILDGQDRVILHSDSDWLQTGGQITEKFPMPRQTISDPVLKNLAEQERLEEFGKAADLGIYVSFVPADEDEFIVMTAELSGFSSVPLTIGQYYRGATVSREVHRLSGSMIVGLGMLAVSVVIAFWLGRRVSRPLRNLARQSERVGALNLNEVEKLPRSRVAEMDQVAIAFNSMVEGLKAMNTYVPRSLFIKLMRLGGSKAAEAREADLTILFSDIVGFTALSEHMSAEETADILNTHFAILVEAVETEGGTVDKFMGDGMLAFWGAPDARPDHAEAAVRAARRIAAALHTANAKAAAQGRPPIRMRVGIHSGPAVVGNVGAHDRWNYTVVGDTVNAAERLQHLGREVAGEPEMTILASADTVARLPVQTGLTAVGEHYLRGRSERMDVFWLDPHPPKAAEQDSLQERPVSAAE
ncbi:adenylate/guanylate cyclase domain-containing protein [Roseibium denhamense]|nr:adenylate/guanylate cyclase domain-containing protein [Roseibium denhamense]